MLRRFKFVVFANNNSYKGIKYSNVMGKVNCGYCKKEIKKNSRECPHCGKKFKMFEEQERTDNFSFETINLQKIFSISFIISLIIGSLIGIFVFISGGIEEIKIKFLITTFAIGGFSLTALCASIWYEKKKFLFISFPGIVSSILGLFYSILLIWEIIDIHSPFNPYPSFNLIKPLLILGIISISSAYSSLMLLGYEKGKKLVKIIIGMTVGQIFAGSLMLIYLIIILGGKVGEPFFEILAIFGVLIVLGTIATGILKEIDKLNEK